MIYYSIVNSGLFIEFYTLGDIYVHLEMNNALLGVHACVYCRFHRQPPYMHIFREFSQQTMNLHNCIDHTLLTCPSGDVESQSILGQVNHFLNAMYEQYCQIAGK